ncbi:MAG TPA: helix-turn-helix transcriptional regulator [Burkholderiales bacterium]|nr:helix-turn-helix transcriptional regulator [Burkholderiales bacterium]
MALNAAYINHSWVPKLTIRHRDPALLALGKAIRSTRLSRDISQEQLALRAEVDRSYVGRVERGDNNVAILTLMRLAAALDTPMWQLLRKAKL